MKQVAFVKTNGEIAYILSPGTDADYTDGEEYGEYTARDISANADPVGYVERVVWHNSEWLIRDPRPSNSHIWVNNSWEIDLETAYATLRSERDVKLYETDRFMLIDSPIEPSLQDALKIYRQALRDLPANTPDPTNVEWPLSPI